MPNIIRPTRYLVIPPSCDLEDDDVFMALSIENTQARIVYGNDIADLSSQAPFDIDSVVSPTAYLVKEHFQDWRRKYAADLSVMLVSRTFGSIVDPYRHGMSEKKNKSLVVTEREKVGLPIRSVSAPWTSGNSLAIEAGSFVAVSEAGKLDEVSGYNISDNQLRIGYQIAEYLAPRIIAEL